MKRNWILLAVLILFVVLFTGCTQNVDRVQIMFPNQSEQIAVGQELKLIPSIYGGSGTLVFESDDEEIVTVSGDVVTGVALGSANITVYFEEDPNVSDIVEIIVADLAGTSMVINANSNVLVKNETLQLTALIIPSYASQEVTWSSSNVDVATISETGLVTGVSEGSVVMTAVSTIDTTLTASYTIQVNNYATATNITITNTETELFVGHDLQMTCTILPANASPTPIWAVGVIGDTGTATITELGVLSGLTAGTVTVLAKDPYNQTIRGTYNITVKYDDPESVAITAGTFLKKIGATVQLTAAVTPATANQNVTWTSSDTAIATVSATGLVTLVSYGDVTITATSVEDSLITATYAIEDIPEATGLTVTYTGTYPMENGGTLQLVSTMAFAAGVETSGIDQTVTWSSSNTAAATVDPTTGLVTRVNVYFDVIITATSNAYPSITGTFRLQPLSWQ